jgi:hypothetical protein
MPEVDLDFRKYVERKKGAREAEAREGAAYAYAGDLRILRTLDKLRPVRVALEATVRLWKSAAREELLAGAVRATQLREPAIYEVARRCAERLHVEEPPTFVVQEGTEPVRVVGTNEEPVIVVSASAFAAASELERLALVGRAVGAIQNHHVLFATALHYLQHDAGRFLRWTVSPAVIALERWSRRAEVTRDRAGLLCARDVEATEAALRKIGGEKRVEALRIFAETTYYLGVLGQEGGINQSTCDARVADTL